MRKIPISVLVPTKNEGKNIFACLSQLSSFDQVVVVDSSSKDSTQTIAEDFDIEFCDFKWNGEYPKKKQWAIQNIEFRNEWLLIIDADERISEEFINELNDFVSQDNFGIDALSVETDFYFSGHRLKYGHKSTKVILIRLGKCWYQEIENFEEGGYFDVELHYQPHVEGKIRKLKSRLLHGEETDLFSWLLKHLHYAEADAISMLDSNSRKIMESHKSRKAQFFHKLPFKPLTFFVYSYVLKRGFLDGRMGLHYSIFMSSYFWLGKVLYSYKTMKRV